MRPMVVELVGGRRVEEEAEKEDFSKIKSFGDVVMLEAERKELDIGIKAELDAERKEIESSIEVAEKLNIAVEVASIKVAGKLNIAIGVASIKVVAKVGRMRLYSEVAKKVGQADLYASNLLAFLEDSEIEAVAKHIKIAEKLDIAIKVANIAKVARKLNLQNLKALDS